MYLLYLFLALACLFDYATGKIPNFLQFILWGAGLVYSYGIGGFAGLIKYLIVALLVFIFLYPFFAISAIGAGDVKLIALSAGFFGSYEILWYVFFIFVVATIFALVKMVVTKGLKTGIKRLFSYTTEIISRRNIGLYHLDKREQRKASIALSGPILISAILHMGGLY